MMQEQNLQNPGELRMLPPNTPSGESVQMSFKSQDAALKKNFQNQLRGMQNNFTGNPVE